MKLKSKMISTVLSMTLALGVMGFAVYAAATQTLTVNNTVNFVSNHVLANILGDVQGVAANPELDLDYNETVDSSSEEGYLQSKPWNIGDMRFDEETGTIEITITITNLSKERSFTFEFLNNQYSAWNGEDLDGSNITRNVVYTTTNAAPVSNEIYTGGKVAVESEKKVEILITLNITDTGKSVDNFNNSFDIELKNVGANGEQPEEPEQPDAPLFQADLEKPLLIIPQDKATNLNMEDLPEMIVEDKPAYYGLYEDENYENKVTFPYTGGQTTLYPKFGEDRTDMVFELINDGTEYAVKSSATNVYGTTLEIPESYRNLPITKIGKFWSSAASHVTNIVIPKSITTIEARALTDTAWYKNQEDGWVVLGHVLYNYKATLMPAGTVYDNDSTDITVIADSALSDPNGRLIEVNISKSVKVIGKSALAGNRSLTKITVDSDNQYYKSVDNALYTKDGSILLRAPAGITSFDIPEGVKKIAQGAFTSINSLATINAPSTLEDVEGYTFTGTAWLTNQPNGLVYFGNVLITYKGDIPVGTSIVVKNGTVAIAEGALDLGNNRYNYTSLSLPTTLKKIGNSAFHDSRNLTSVILPEGLEYIGVKAFYQTGITSLTIPGSVKYLAADAFMQASSLTTVTVNEGVLTIGPNAFSGASALHTVNLPSTIVQIGASAFSGTALISIQIPTGISMIEERTFYGAQLTQVHIPENINIIAPQAFGTGYSGTITKVYIDSALVAKDFLNEDSQGSILKKLVTNNELFIRSDISNIGSYVTDNFTQNGTVDFGGNTYNRFVKN